jgi:hypothetical protein
MWAAACKRRGRRLGFAGLFQRLVNHAEAISGDETMTSLSKQKKIIKAALDARTPAEVDALKELLDSHVGGEVKWRPVGDIPDNLGAINAASDARLALNERYTNAIDAVIELEARRLYGDGVPRVQ